MLRDISLFLINDYGNMRLDAAGEIMLLLMLRLRHRSSEVVETLLCTGLKKCPRVI